MYQSGIGNSVPILAVTGATVAFHVVAAWTLLVAGIALVTISRVLWKRSHPAP